MHEIFVPAMGMAPDEVVLVSWSKQLGDRVAAGDVVATIETSKAQMEVQSEVDGILGRHRFQVDDAIEPGTTITVVLESDETEPDVVAPAPLPAAQPPQPVEPVIVASVDTPPVRHTTSPRRRRISSEAAGPSATSGPSTTPDVGPRRDAGSVGTRAGAHHHQDAFREAISASVSRSWEEIPHFAVTRELRVGQLVMAVTEWRAVLPELTLTDLLLRALALSLLERQTTSELDIGLAVATQRGVAIPVIRSVPRLGLVELIATRKAAVERARAGRMHPADARVAVTTLSNLGAVGVDQFTGVVPYGQTSMLTVGRAAPRPVVDGGALGVDVTMYATLNVDHRAWDGYHAGQTLERFARVVAAPAIFFGDADTEPAEERL